MKISLILSLFFAFVCGNAAAADKINIAAFGDSLSAGYGLSAKDGFAMVLQQTLIRRGLPAVVSNAGVAGDTSADGLARVEWMLQEKPDVVIVEFGANDMFRGTPVAAIQKNLAAIIQHIQQSDALVLLVGMQAPANYPPSYRRQFAAMYQELSDAHQTLLYPFFLEGVALHPQFNQADGIHPNAAGVRVIARNITPLVAALAARLP